MKPEALPGCRIGHRAYSGQLCICSEVNVLLTEKRGVVTTPIQAKLYRLEE